MSRERIAPKTQHATKTEQRNLQCQFTEEELSSKGRALADKHIEMAQYQADAKDCATQFKAKIAAAEAEASGLSHAISSGYEYRRVDCTVHMDTPSVGRKTIIRDDTGQQVEVEDMTADEMQGSLDLESA